MISAGPRWRHASAARYEETAFWLGLHELYPPVARLLRENAGSVAVVTAKDAASVRTVLEFHGLGDTVAEVIGECGQKAEAVRDLCERGRIAPAAVTFVDDNLGGEPPWTV